MVYNGKPYWNSWFGGTPILETPTCFEHNHSGEKQAFLTSCWHLETSCLYGSLSTWYLRAWVFLMIAQFYKKNLLPQSCSIVVGVPPEACGSPFFDGIYILLLPVAFFVSNTAFLSDASYLTKAFFKGDHLLKGCHLDTKQRHLSFPELLLLRGFMWGCSSTNAIVERFSFQWQVSTFIVLGCA